MVSQSSRLISPPWNRAVMCPVDSTWKLMIIIILVINVFIFFSLYQYDYFLTDIWALFTAVVVVLWLYWLTLWLLSLICSLSSAASLLSWFKSAEMESGQTWCLSESLEVKVNLTSLVEIIPHLCCCRFINEPSDPPASNSLEKLLLSCLIHNKWSCCVWQEHEEETPRRDHDWHFVIKWILSVLRASSLQKDCQETIILPLAGWTDGLVVIPRLRHASGLSSCSCRCCSQRARLLKEKLHPPWRQHFKSIRLIWRFRFSCFTSVCMFGEYQKNQRLYLCL